MKIRIEKYRSFGKQFYLLRGKNLGMWYQKTKGGLKYIGKTIFLLFLFVFPILSYAQISIPQEFPTRTVIHTRVLDLNTLESTGGLTDGSTVNVISNCSLSSVENGTYTFMTGGYSGSDAFFSTSSNSVLYYYDFAGTQGWYLGIPNSSNDYFMSSTDFNDPQGTYDTAQCSNNETAIVSDLVIYNPSEPESTTTTIVSLSSTTLALLSGSMHMDDLIFAIGVLLVFLGVFFIGFLFNNLIPKRQ